MVTYTGYIVWDKEVEEEVDVKATSEKEARIKINEVLKKDYQNGGKIAKLVERVPGVLFM